MAQDSFGQNIDQDSVLCRTLVSTPKIINLIPDAPLFSGCGDSGQTFINFSWQDGVSDGGSAITSYAVEYYEDIPGSSPNL